MKLLSHIRLGAFLLIGLNLLMAFGSIWIFTRMAPAIEIIIDQNERSLEACEKMLTALALNGSGETDKNRLLSLFVESLKTAQNNITELGEPEALDSITNNYRSAFAGDTAAAGTTISAINRLGEINREAMIRADKRARQLGNGGAWGVVFMASAVFLAGLFFVRILQRNVVRPLEEIYHVVTASQLGDTGRRCSEADIPKDIKTIFDGINGLLDTIHFRRY
jgi:hypothetical protein